MRSLLYALGVAGTVGTWGRTVADGTLSHLLHALHGANPYILPGTQSALIRKFTGIFPVDYLLKVLVVFFWEAVDGSHPATSTIGIYFLGQILPIVVWNYLENARAANGLAASLRWTTTWLLVFQACALGSAGFVWALTFLKSSVTVSSKLDHRALKQASLVEPRRAILIIPAVVVGYMVPAVLMALPSPALVTSTFQQLAVVAWNIYPLITSTILLVLQTFAAPSSRVTSSETNAGRAQHLRTVRLVAGLTAVASSAIHISISAISLSTFLFPAIFKPEYIRELSPSSLFIPPLALSATSTVGDGVRSFFLWDQLTGYLTIMVVIWQQFRVASETATGSYSLLKTVAAMVVMSAVLGPGSACLVMSWWKDEVLFARPENSTKKS